MNQFILSRNLFFALSITFIIVRLFFTIRFRKTEESSQKDNKKDDSEGRLNFFVRRFVILPLLIVSFWLFYTLNPSWMRIFIIPLPEVVLWIVAVIGYAGIAFLIWIHICLGKEWSAKLKLQNHHKLIKSGPYSKIRHPMYTSLFTIYLSTALISANFLIILLMISAIISLIIRLPKEEEMLISEFGDDYKNYIRNTGRFFPKL